MTEKRKLKKKGQSVPAEQEVKPSKVEYAVASYMKKHVPTKKTKFLSHQVSYFTAHKAIDVLMGSPWATGKDILFTDRPSVVAFCEKLLRHKFFHRARKIPVTDCDLRPKDLKKKKEKEAKKKEVEVIEKKKDDEKEKSGKDEKPSEDKEEEGKEKSKKKSKIKLDMHLEQVFVDGSDAYVWMYDPLPFWYYIVGALFLFGAVAVCLFPLWPPIVRKGVYYLSIAGAGFLGVIFALAILRFIIFIIIWSLSMGRHHFWILPNLTEDVGFFASFWPLYKYEYHGENYDKRKKHKKKRVSADEGVKSEPAEGTDNQSAVDTDKQETDAGRDQGSPSHSTSESENSNSQAFEMLNKEDLCDGDDGAEEASDAAET